MEEPNIEIALWLIQALNDSSPALQSKLQRFDILFTIIGLIPHLKGNKELVWGMLIFTLDMIGKLIENFTQHYSNQELQDLKIFSGGYVAQLHKYFHRVSSLESDNEWSKRTQLMGEVLLQLNILDKTIKEHLKA